MKKHYILKVFVAIFFAAFGVSNGFAQSLEELVFLGTKMTKENGNNLDPNRTWVQSGSVKYDAENRVITLDNAQIVVTAENCPTYYETDGITKHPIVGTFRFYCPDDDITINLVGKNSITTTQTGFVMIGYQGIPAVKVTFTGSGNLTIDAGRSGIDMRTSGTLEFKDVDYINVKAANMCGINGDGLSNRFYVINTNVDSYGRTGAICQFNRFVLKGVECTSPVQDPNATPIENPEEDNVSVSLEKGGVTNKGGYAYDRAILERIKTNGIEKSTANKSDAKVVAIYDASGRVLKEMQKGINIVRYSDNSVKKVIK
ncbi:hypothetical protein [Prevotella sp. HUN102]|uniref:hypothetical protein n=1 Tax=Prevotella sp. HUN102 TaxID=1392486 RepID=UPI00048BE05D|nr:hypothetical protein [Prevotella sp. HUN102]